jgi:adenylosuccinate synthase
VLGISRRTRRESARVLPTELDDSTGELLRTRGKNSARPPDGRAVAAGSMRRRSGAPSDQQRFRPLHPQARRARRDGQGEALHGYRIDGADELLPFAAEDAARCEPVYEELPGWKESTVGISAYDKLPAPARAYLERLQSVCRVPIDMISTGADRNETIVLRHPFH